MTEDVSRTPAAGVGICGWESYYPALEATETNDIKAALQTFIAENNLSQFIAWDRSIPVVKQGAAAVLRGHQESKQFSAIFEYELPREGGRRPDVVLLQNGSVIVLEFKDKSSFNAADVDQVSAYARDLKSYHEHCHDVEVLPVLIPTYYRGEETMVDGVTVLPPTLLGDFLLNQYRRDLGPSMDVHTWLNAQYLPLPSLVRAARLLFERQPLPSIKRAESARIPAVVDLILAICKEAARTQTKRLVLLTGVPGSGKTLVGLQVAHHEGLESLRVLRNSTKNGGAPAVFLSGNGPLVQVLQDALGSTVFVAGMKKFIEYYLYRRPDVVPTSHVIIFDEAQRAWDMEHMQSKHDEAVSEPEALLRIARRIPEWCVILGLVGEGQEIHKGEEAGLLGWTEAAKKLEAQDSWTVHGPIHIADLFRETPIRLESSSLLNLVLNENLTKCAFYAAF